MSESQAKFEKALYYIDGWVTYYSYVIMDAMSLACKV